jgi:hypothetical protein
LYYSSAYPKVELCALQQKRKGKGKGKKKENEEDPQVDLKQLHTHLACELLMLKRQQRICTKKIERLQMSVGEDNGTPHWSVHWKLQDLSIVARGDFWQELVNEHPILYRLGRVILHWKESWKNSDHLRKMASCL